MHRARENLPFGENRVCKRQVKIAAGAQGVLLQAKRCGASGDRYFHLTGAEGLAPKP